MKETSKVKSKFAKSFNGPNVKVVVSTVELWLAHQEFPSSLPVQNATRRNRAECLYREDFKDTNSLNWMS